MGLDLQPVEGGKTMVNFRRSKYPRQNLNLRDEQNFQTPVKICELMVSRVNGYPKTILEPASGKGNLLNAIKNKFPGSKVISPDDFNAIDLTVKEKKIDYIISNPPFSPMQLGYQFVNSFLNLSYNVIVLQPYNALIDSDSRTEFYIKNGLKEVIHLPRRTFKGVRVQTCILVFDRKHKPNEIKYSFEALLIDL